MIKFKYVASYAILIMVWALSSCSELDMNEPGNLVPKTTDLDDQLPSIEINGVKLHSETFGSITNPIIIFIPGGPGTDYCGMINRIDNPVQSRYPFQRTQSNLGLDQLSDEYFCVFFDPRGAGLSPRFDKGSLSLDQYHDDLNKIIDHYLQLKASETGVLETQVVLAGHSFGGLYATSFINKYPDRVKDVILFEPTPLSKEALDKLIQTSVFALITEEWLTEYLYSLEHLSYDDHARADYHRILGFTQSFPELEYPKNVPIWRYGAFANAELELKTFRAKDYDITSNLSQFEGRALFVWGGKTRAMDQSGKDLQMSYYTNHQSTTIPNTGHYMLYEDPDLTAQSIRLFLN